jgi:hypothetical protein
MQDLVCVNINGWDSASPGVRGQIEWVVIRTSDLLPPDSGASRTKGIIPL